MYANMKGWVINSYKEIKQYKINTYLYVCKYIGKCNLFIYAKI